MVQKIYDTSLLLALLILFIYSSECNLTSISLQFYEIPLLVVGPQKEAVAC